VGGEWHVFNGQWNGTGSRLQSNSGKTFGFEFFETAKAGLFDDF